MNPRDAWKYSEFNIHTLNKREKYDYSYLAALILSSLRNNISGGTS